MFKFMRKDPQETKTLKGVYENVLEGTERYMTKSLGQVMSMAMPGFPDELDSETVGVINDALAYWKESKAALIQQAEIMDNRDKDLRTELAEQRKILEQQTKILEELSRRKDK